MLGFSKNDVEHFVNNFDFIWTFSYSTRHFTCHKETELNIKVNILFMLY